MSGFALSLDKRDVDWVVDDDALRSTSWVDARLDVDASSEFVLLVAATAAAAAPLEACVLVLLLSVLFVSVRWDNDVAAAPLRVVRCVVVDVDEVIGFEVHAPVSKLKKKKY